MFSLSRYDIMKECLSGSPSERPTFTYLVDKFERMLEDGSDYLDCNIKMVTNPSYFASNENQGIYILREYTVFFSIVHLKKQKLINEVFRK